MYIRKELKRRPELAKPLFVIRNIKLYKAFEGMKLAVTESKIEKMHGARSSYALYLRLVRKGWESLRKNQVKIQQERKLLIIRNLFTQRRWFFNLHKAAYQCKRRR